MGLSTRELYLVLRARDEASRVVRGLSGELLRSGAAAAAASERSAAAAARAHAMQLKATGASRAQVRTAMMAAKAHDDEARAIMNAAAQRQHYVSLISQTGDAMQTVGATTALVGVATGAWLVSNIKVAQEWGRQVALTKTQVDGFEASLQDISKAGLDIANTVGVAFEDIQPALFDVFSSTNANLKQAKTLTEAFAKASVAGQSSIQTASKGTISIMNAFNIPLEKVNDVLDIQFQTVRKGRLTYTEFGNVIGNIIPSATRAGQSFETVGAMLAYMTRNGLSAAMAATSGARALEAMSHPKTIQRLEDMGIKVRDVNGKMLPLNETLHQLRDRLEKLPPTDRVKALVDLFKGSGGTIQARRFLEQVLLRPGELEEYEGYLKDMQGAQGAFSASYNEMANTVASKTELLRNRWKILQEQLGEALIPYFSKAVDKISALIKSFNDLPQSTKDTIAGILVIVAALLTFGGAGTVALGFIVTLASAVAALGTGVLVAAGIIAAIVIGIGIFAVALKTAYDKSSTFRDIIKDVWGRLGELRDIVGEVGDKLSTAWSEHMSGPLERLWDVITNKVLPVLRELSAKAGDEIIPKIREAGRIIGSIFAWALEHVGSIINTMVVPALAWLAEWWQKNKSTIEPLFPILGQIVKWFLIIAAVVAGVLVVAFIGPLVAAVVAVIAVFTAGIATAKAIWSALKWLGGGVSDLANQFLGLVSKAWTAASGLASWARSIPGMVRSGIGDLGGLLLNAGQEIINGLMQGIRNKFDDLKSLLGTVGKFIQDHKGPIDYDRKMLRPAGRAIISGLMGGIRSMFPDLLSEIERVNNAIVVDPNNGNTSPFAPTLTAPQPTTIQKTIYQTFNITTQEIDPRKHSADLGWELQAVTP